MWGGVGVGTSRMVNQDMSTFHVEQQVGDCFSTQRANNSVIFDNMTTNASTTGCVNNVDTFSGGLDTSTISAAYYYLHFSRDTVTTDTTCDDDIKAGTTQCYVWYDGDTSLMNFQIQHDGSTCFTLTNTVHAWMLMAVMSMLLVTIL